MQLQLLQAYPTDWQSQHSSQNLCRARSIHIYVYVCIYLLELPVSPSCRCTPSCRVGRCVSCLAVWY